MGLVNWVFGKKPKASEQAPSTKTLGGTPDGKVKACSQDVSPQANTLSHDEDFTIEELGSAERTLNAETESGDEPDLEARSSNKAQVSVSLPLNGVQCRSNYARSNAPLQRSPLQARGLPAQSSCSEATIRTFWTISLERPLYHWFSSDPKRLYQRIRRKP